MLAIRLQRRGRKGHAQYRVVVQDKDLSPKSGRVVYNLGPFNPHTKTAELDKEKAKFYLDNGAQPSNTAAKILKAEGVKLPKWVEIDTSFKGSLKNPDKLRKNQPDEPEAKEEAPADEESADSSDEAPTEASDDSPEQAEEKPAEESKEDSKEEEKKEETPAEEPKEEKADDSEGKTEEADDKKE